MKSNYRKIGDFIRLIDERNIGLRVKTLLGLSISKQFIPSVANIIGTDMENYKIIRRNQFACSMMQVRRDKKMPVALLQEMDEAIISQAYPVFEVIDLEILLPEYLMMWFTRQEFDREACFYAIGGVRGSLEWEDFCNMQLPVPSIEKQKEIVKEYNIILNRISLNNQLIQKLEKTAQTIYKQWFVDFEFPDENGKPYKSNGGKMVESELGEIPEGWKVEMLLNLASYMNRGITPKYTDRKGVVILNQRCVKNNTIDFSYSKIHDINVKMVNPERFLQKFDILINSTGKGTLGRVGFVKETPLEILVDSHITIVRTSIIDKIYLWFNLSLRTSEIENLGEGSTDQTELGRENLGNLNVLVPKRYILDRFNILISPFIKHYSQIEQQTHPLNVLNELLLSKLAAIKS